MTVPICTLMLFTLLMILNSVQSMDEPYDQLYTMSGPKRVPPGGKFIFLPDGVYIPQVPKYTGPIWVGDILLRQREPFGIIIELAGKGNVPVKLMRARNGALIYPWRPAIPIEEINYEFQDTLQHDDRYYASFVQTGLHAIRLAA